jgi:hypothetical protein
MPKTTCWSMAQTKMIGPIATKTHTYHCRNFWLSENIGVSICICVTRAERTSISILYSLFSLEQNLVNEEVEIAQSLRSPMSTLPYNATATQVPGKYEIS